MLVLWGKLDQETDSIRTTVTLRLQGAISKPWKPGRISVSNLLYQREPRWSNLEFLSYPLSSLGAKLIFMEPFLSFFFKVFSILLYIQKTMVIFLPHSLYVYIQVLTMSQAQLKIIFAILIWIFPMHFSFFLSSSAGKFWRSHVTPACIPDIKWWLLLLVMGWWP